ncbi:Asp-tRNA(Asn)/Glu-tRNA(Gln) amidotransferase subunit GatB [Candidatus Omnitrophota bacterium]
MGKLRCDANISVMPKNAQSLGEKVELKNMNSFKGVKAALEYEIQRQIELLENNVKVVPETRLWDVEKNLTVSMRSKEQAHDYRYFPEPDLVPFVLDDEYIQKIRESLPELPQQRAQRFISDYQIPEYDAAVLTSDKYLAEYFEQCVRFYPKPKVVSNWLMTELLAQLNSRNLQARNLPIKPESLVAVFQMIDQGIISGKIAKEILPEMLDTKKEAGQIVQDKGLRQISDSGELEEIIQKVIAENPKPVSDYYQGQDKAFMFLIGQIMRHSRGKANPKIINQILKTELERRKNA